MPYVFLAAVYFFSFYLGAVEYDATSFTCEGNNQRLILKIAKDTRDIKLMSLIANETVWLANSITRKDNIYTIDVSPANSVASGSPTAGNEIDQISFELPRAKVRGVQTGGYYIPVMTYYPASFSMDINARFADQSENTFCVSCVGN